MNDFKNERGLTDQERVEQLVEAVENAGADIFPDHASWVQGAMACCNLGLSGKALFHRLASYSPKNAADADEKLFDDCMKKSRGEVNVGTLFYLASLAGVQVKTVTTARTAKTASPCGQGQPLSPALSPTGKGSNGEDGPTEEPYITPYMDVERLPRMVREALSIVDDSPGKAAVRDMLLLSVLTACSYALPRFRFYHGLPKHAYEANLMAMILAPAASGKGVMNWVRMLLNPIHWQLRDDFKREKAAWEALSDEEKKQQPEPKRQMVFIPVNASMPAFMQQLGDNQGRGIAMATEMDTLSQIWGQDYGQFSDVFRCAAEHEAISQRRRKDDEYFEIDNPQLSVLLSGTYNQMQPLIKNRENGLMSRFACYVVRDTQPFDARVFEDDSADTVNSPGFETFCRLGQEMKELHQWQLQQPSDRLCTFRLTDAQKQRIMRLFSGQYKAYMAQMGSEYDPTIKRMAVIVKRVGLVLSALRLYEENGSFMMPDTMVCRDEDFEVMLLLANKLMLHAGLCYEMLPEVEKKTPPIGKSMRQQQFFCALDEEFTRQDASDLGRVTGISIRTIDYWLMKYTESGDIQRLDAGIYRKGRNG